MALEPWRRVPGTALLFLLNLFTAVALVFEGYNQGECLALIPAACDPETNCNKQV
jgi:hypothetical protein